MISGGAVVSAVLTDADLVLTIFLQTSSHQILHALAACSVQLNHLVQQVFSQLTSRSAPRSVADALTDTLTVDSSLVSVPLVAIRYTPHSSRCVLPSAILLQARPLVVAARATSPGRASMQMESCVCITKMALCWEHGVCAMNTLGQGNTTPSLTLTHSQPCTLTVTHSDPQTHFSTLKSRRLSQSLAHSLLLTRYSQTCPTHTLLSD